MTASVILPVVLAQTFVASVYTSCFVTPRTFAQSIQLSYHAVPESPLVQFPSGSTAQPRSPFRVVLNLVTEHNSPIPTQVTVLNGLIPADVTVLNVTIPLFLTQADPCCAPFEYPPPVSSLL